MEGKHERGKTEKEKAAVEENSSSNSELNMFKRLVKIAATKRSERTPGPSSSAPTTSGLKIIDPSNQILTLGNNKNSKNPAKTGSKALATAPSQAEPKSTFFDSGSALIDGSGELSSDFLARVVGGFQADNLTDEELRDQFASHLLKICMLSVTLLSGWSSKAPTFDVLSRLKTQKTKLENLSAQVSQLSAEKQQVEQQLARLYEENYKLDAQLLDALANHDRELVQAKDEWYAKGQKDCYTNFPNTKDGKKVLEAYWETKKMKFLKSVEFQEILAEKALDCYYHGFESCVKQLRPHDLNLCHLDREAGLDDLPEPENLET